MDAKRFSAAIKSIYAAVADLEEMFPGRRFTPDGHMVGGIGEALASHHYGIVLHPSSTETHDGHAAGKQVQVKATQGKGIGLSSEPEHLLVLSIHKNGSFTEIYNGPGGAVWAEVSHKKLPKNSQRRISLAKLRVLQGVVRKEDRLALKRPQEIC